jgi:hypothetical protein
MTPTQGTASSRPQTAEAATIGRSSSRIGLRGRGRRFVRRELLALPAALALLVPAAPALAATTTGTSSTGTSGYSQKPPAPTTKTEPKKEVEPSKEASKTTPQTTPEPAKEPVTTPTTTTPKASTLPFTGLNLTWVVGAGVLLLGAGLSIRLALRTRSGR